MLKGILEDVALRVDEAARASRLDDIALLAGRLSATTHNYQRHRELLVAMAAACVAAIEAADLAEQRRLRALDPTVVDLSTP